ncbi:MAG TPA: penicillin-binding transpeptidase domain-containing protein [Bryobacteraceae bacterium]|nr:penicillin-binding transpeptidase domain-containing protein [Bryobacteraceae bacterium]
MLVSFAACAGAAAQPRVKSLRRFFRATRGSAILIDISTRSVIASYEADISAVPPGSTIKPFALAALLAAHKLTEKEAYVCPGKLEIAGRELNCSHPPLAEPLHPDTAIAYSCNCFVAHVAQRFAPGEFAKTLERAGFIHGVRLEQGDAARLQALGEDGILASAEDLANAYRWLALNAPEPVLAGLEGAVEYGTAHLARVPGLSLAGKTGTVRTAIGNRVAWFAGFSPSRDARIALSVMIGGMSGGADAAPIAGRILAAHQAGVL